jgi:hypothetical protein
MGLEEERVAVALTFACDEDEADPRNAVHFAPTTTGFLGAAGPVGAKADVGGSVGPPCVWTAAGFQLPSNDLGPFGRDLGRMFAEGRMPKGLEIVGCGVGVDKGSVCGRDFET